MGSQLVKHNPELKVDGLVEILEKAFGDRYEVYKTALIGADVIVKKSGWTGVSIKLVQKADKTVIRYGVMAPSALVRILMAGILPWLILRFTVWAAIQKEFEAFVKGSPDLN